MKHITALRDRQRDQHNPGATIGDCLIRQSTCPEYLVSQLTAYLAAAQADLSDHQRRYDITVATLKECDS